MNKPDIFYTAVKGLIKDKDNKVLVLKQSDATITGDGMYHPPGGILEEGESLEDCVIREIKEELGVKSTVSTLFDKGNWQAERDGQLMQFKGLFYICEVESKNFELQREEASDIYWVGLDAVDKIGLMEPSKSIIKKYLLTLDNSKYVH